MAFNYLAVARSQGTLRMVLLRRAMSRAMRRAMRLWLLRKSPRQGRAGHGRLLHNQVVSHRDQDTSAKLPCLKSMVSLISGWSGDEAEPSRGNR